MKAFLKFSCVFKCLCDSPHILSWLCFPARGIGFRKPSCCHPLQLRTHGKGGMSHTDFYLITIGAPSAWHMRLLCPSASCPSISPCLSTHTCINTHVRAHTWILTHIRLHRHSHIHIDMHTNAHTLLSQKKNVFYCFFVHDSPLRWSIIPRPIQLARHLHSRRSPFRRLALLPGPFSAS